MSVLKAALEAANISIKEFNQKKQKPIKLSTGTVTIPRFCSELQKSLGKRLKDFPEILDAIQDPDEMVRLLEEYCLEELSAPDAKTIPSDLAHLTLNIDMSSNDPGYKKFFCTSPDEIRETEISGQYYLGKASLSPAEAIHVARPVVPKYLPRAPLGVYPMKNRFTGQGINYLNTYIPPSWELLKNRNKKEWDKIPAKPPEIIIRMLKHIIPNKEERNYFYAWLYTSMAKRAYVYLLLCGNPGVGKNRLKLLVRALHGFNNSADGKKETLGANQSKFNSQMEENTFLWFDELKFGPEMEPRMKEYQNDYISIEKKGQDSSRSTEIHCSMVISNNYARDNYLLFNSRKFAPLVLGSSSLLESMTAEEIKDISERLDETNPRFDVKLVAQIAKWILAIAPKHLSKWPNLEYQGPMFLRLAHTSMSRWQKIAVLALTVQNKRGPFKGWDETKQAFLWSKVEQELRVKKEYDSRDYRDATTVRVFFETYRDILGAKVFEVEEDPSSVVQDFWVKPIGGLQKKNIQISLNNGQGDQLSALIRPPGISEFQWKKMKDQHEALNKAFRYNDDKDLL